MACRSGRFEVTTAEGRQQCQKQKKHIYKCFYVHYDQDIILQNAEFVEHTQVLGNDISRTAAMLKAETDAAAQHVAKFGAFKLAYIILHKKTHARCKVCNDPDNNDK